MHGTDVKYPAGYQKNSKEKLILLNLVNLSTIPLSTIPYSRLSEERRFYF